MPLTKRQFELGITGDVEDRMRQVYYFLAGSRNLAYSEGELKQNILEHQPSRGPFAVEDILRALEVLQAIGAIERRDVGGTKYYSFHREIDTNSWD